MNLKEEISLWAEEILLGSDAYVVDITGSDVSGKYTVALDADSGLDIKTCTKVNRYINAMLEERIPEHTIAIEVASPGTDQPLKLVRQYKKHVGRNAEIILNDGNKHSGKIISVDEKSLIISEQGEKKHLKKETEIPFENILTTKIIVSFK